MSVSVDVSVSVSALERGNGVAASSLWEPIRFGALGRPFRRSSTVPALEGSSLRRISPDSEGYVKTSELLHSFEDSVTLNVTLLC